MKNYVLKFNSGDFFQLAWNVNNLGISITTVPENLIVGIPESPGAILTVTQVMYTQVEIGRAHV